MIKSRVETGAEIRQTGPQGLPFIGPFRPFVGPANPLIRPFVPKNRPFVCIQRQSGLTLVELIVTVVLAAILLSLAAPNLSTFIQRDRLATQANNLVADFAIARSEAIKRGRTVTVCKIAVLATPTSTPQCITGNDTAAWTTGRAVFVDVGGTANQIDAGTDIVLRVREPLDGNDNALYGDGNSSGTANRIVFNGLGMANPPSSNSQFVLCDQRGAAQALAIALGPTGRARVTEHGKDKDGNALVASDCP